MSIATELSAQAFTGVAANVPLNNNFPLYATNEVQVVYGSQGLIATEVLDYTVELSPPNFNSFTVTPKANLINKINNLIAVPPTSDVETNFVVVRRFLSYKTSVEPEIVRNTPFLSKEIDRIHMKLIQLAERVARTISLPATVVGNLINDYIIGEPVEGFAPVWRGNKLNPELSAANIAAAQGYASQAAASLTAVNVSKAAVQTLTTQAQAAAALLPKNNYTATVDPTVNNDNRAGQGYAPGSQWINVTTGDRFSCSSAAFGAAIWTEISADLSALHDMAYEDKANYATAAELNVRASKTKAADVAINGAGPFNFSSASGAWQKGIVSAAAALTFSFPAGAALSFTLELENGGAFPPTWPGPMEWGGGVEPTLTVTGRDHIVIYTDGTKIYGSLVGKDMK